jgi:hypothetical protein
VCVYTVHQWQGKIEIGSAHWVSEEEVFTGSFSGSARFHFAAWRGRRWGDGEMWEVVMTGKK